MKKKNLKLGLNKSNVSNLNALRGGKSIFDGDSEAGLCDTGYELTILNDTTCGLHCGFQTYEVFSCPTNCGGVGTQTQGGETC